MGFNTGMTTIANRISKAIQPPVQPEPNPVLVKAQADVDVLLNDRGLSNQLLDATANFANALEREHLLRLQVSLHHLSVVSAQVMAFSGESIPPGAEKAVVAAAEVVQAALQTYYEQNLSVAAHRIDPKIHELTAVVNAELEKMFDQVEVTRWAALEASLANELAAGHFKTFGSSGAALSYLHNQAKKHNAKLNA